MNAAPVGAFGRAARAYGIFDHKAFSKSAGGHEKGRGKASDESRFELTCFMPLLSCDLKVRGLDQTTAGGARDR